jgi:hypothetical protein
MNFLSMQVSVNYADKVIAKAFFADSSPLKGLEPIYQNLGSLSDTSIIFINYFDELNVLEGYLFQVFETKLKEFLEGSRRIRINLLFFFSPKDLTYAFCFKNIEPFFKERPPKGRNSSWIIQNRCIF